MLVFVLGVLGIGAVPSGWASHHSLDAIVALAHRESGDCYEIVAVDGSRREVVLRDRDSREKYRFPVSDGATITRNSLPAALSDLEPPYPGAYQEGIVVFGSQGTIAGIHAYYYSIPVEVVDAMEGVAWLQDLNTGTTVLCPIVDRASADLMPGAQGIGLFGAGGRLRQFIPYE